MAGYMSRFLRQVMPDDTCILSSCHELNVGHDVKIHVMKFASAHVRKYVTARQNLCHVKFANPHLEMNLVFLQQCMSQYVSHFSLHVKICTVRDGLPDQLMSNILQNTCLTLPGYMWGYMSGKKQEFSKNSCTKTSVRIFPWKQMPEQMSAFVGKKISGYLRANVRFRMLMFCFDGHLAN